MKATAVAAVMALLSVANAERSLLAHKVSGGSSLHGVAITDNFYYTTNGNGSWSNQNNRGYKSAAACGGSSLGTTAGVATPFPAGLSASAQSPPLPFWKLGYSVTAISFPSRLLGVAVGTGCSSFAGYTDPDFSAWSVPATLVPTYVPNIITSFDQGATWQQVTGFSTKPKSFAQTVQYDNAATPVAQPYAIVAPDLMSVHCTTRSLCFAAGGYFGSTAGAATIVALGASASYLDYVQTAVTTTDIIARVMPVAGVIVRSTNGGTYWNYITLPNIAPAQTVSTPAPGTRIGPTPIPGLTDVSTDSSGRHVYAVGAPALVQDATGTPAYSYGTANQNGPEPFNPLAPVTNNAIVSGTIIYSGAYGVTNSWVVQTAPKLPNMWYSLNAVTVLRGTTAIAVGGSPFGVNVKEYYMYTTANTATPPGFAAAAIYTAAQAVPLQPSGVIIMTFNGGFSWLQQNLPSWSYWTGVSGPTAATTAYTVPNTYVTALNSSSFLPALNDVACYATTVGTSPFYNCMAVGDYGYVVKAQYPAVTVSNTVITSTTSWVYQNVTQVSLTSGFLDVYGVTWDNNMVGYMYGYQTILSTHDGGATWISETPNQIITATSDNALIGLATVPTTY